MNTLLSLRPEGVICSHCRDKSHALDRLAALYEEVHGLDRKAIRARLETREKLGSTGFGRGVAIPHCRSSRVERPIMAVMRLAEPIDFGAADAVPVNLLLALVSPEDAGARHLHALAAISRLTRDGPALCALLEAPDADALYALLTDQFLRDAA